MAGEAGSVRFQVTAKRLGLAEAGLIKDRNYPWQGNLWWLVTTRLPDWVYEAAGKDLIPELGIDYASRAADRLRESGRRVEFLEPYEAGSPGDIRRFRMRARTPQGLVDHGVDAVLVQWVEGLLDNGEWWYVTDFGPLPGAYIYVGDEEPAGIVAPRKLDQQDLDHEYGKAPA